MEAGGNNEHCCIHFSFRCRLVPGTLGCNISALDFLDITCQSSYYLLLTLFLASQPWWPALPIIPMYERWSRSFPLTAEYFHQKGIEHKVYSQLFLNCIQNLQKTKKKACSFFIQKNDMFNRRCRRHWISNVKKYFTVLPFCCVTMPHHQSGCVL